MIIKRLAKGIKDQDWFVVTIEVAIVVVGIFIGLQVDDWNEKRKLKAEVLVSYQGLIKDFDAIRPYAEVAVASHKSIANSLRELLLHLRGESTGEIDPAVVAEALSGGDTAFSPPGASATYRSLVSSGSVELVDSRELRGLLAAYDEAIQSTTFRDIRMALTEFQVAFKRHSSVDLGFEFASTDIQQDLQAITISSFDLAQMKEDPDFIIAAEQILRMQYYYHLSHSFTLGYVIEIQDVLEPYRVPPQ